jgi:hypothetical protein
VFVFGCVLYFFLTRRAVRITLDGQGMLKFYGIFSASVYDSKELSFIIIGLKNNKPDALVFEFAGRKTAKAAAESGYAEFIGEIRNFNPKFVVDNLNRSIFFN